MSETGERPPAVGGAKLKWDQIPRRGADKRDRLPDERIDDAGAQSHRREQQAEADRLEPTRSDVERELIRYVDTVAADALFINARHDLGGVKQEIIRKTGAPVMIVPG